MASCPGIRDELEAVRPLPMCLCCTNWQQQSGAVIRPHILVMVRDSGQVLTCSRRVPAKPLAEVG